MVFVDGLSEFCFELRSFVDGERGDFSDAESRHLLQSARVIAGWTAASHYYLFIYWRGSWIN